MPELLKSTVSTGSLTRQYIYLPFNCKILFVNNVGKGKGQSVVEQPNHSGAADRREILVLSLRTFAAAERCCLLSLGRIDAFTAR
jgi:hypothetical protein